ncbi:ABC transporter ATP-binding protein [Cumulibacter soli]|uniref:ABC transporter ATP-binding protein n=1 Tax=Cumulibacter soli TaxID=2546344 RepID=UPI001067DC9A|nr:ABC transporter ATP-binding protein [Cumulibacter soli]
MDEETVPVDSNSTESNATALELDGVRVRFERTVAVEGVRLQVDAEEIVAILGPSGCGKSSLLRAIVGLEPLDGGTVTYDGVDQSAIPVHRRGFGLMFQDGQLFENLSVRQNVGYGPRRHKASRAETTAIVDELLELVGLAGYAARAPSTLSGGQRQRVALARALAAKPRLLLLDEPLSSLDASLRRRLADDLRRVLKQTATTALLVTHDHDEAFAIADRVVLMRDGKFVQQGTPREVWSAPVDEAAALFLGYARVLRSGDCVPLRHAFGLGEQTLALRANALRIAADGALVASVRSVAPALDELRLIVAIEGGEELEAVAPIDAQVATGDVVRLSLFRSGTAAISEN